MFSSEIYKCKLYFSIRNLQNTLGAWSYLVTMTSYTPFTFLKSQLLRSCVRIRLIRFAVTTRCFHTRAIDTRILMTAV